MPQVLRRVGRYDLLEVIGRGGAAVVYLAQQRDLRRPVALKELAPFHADDVTFAERFVEESRLAGSLSHANVVTVHEYFEDGRVPYIAMEHLPHGSLRQYVGQVSIAQIAGVLEGVLAGLSHGEGHGIAHRDLKPENLLVATDGRVKIADFGVARAYNKAATRAVVTAAGTTIGTPAYMAPEQALGGELTAATDLYSLGIIAWELLTGQVPFEETDTPVAVLYRHVHEPVPPVRSLAPDVDERLDQWVQRMLAKRPEDRFQRADDAWEELEDIVLDLLGPRWRREARLVVESDANRAEQTLTPAAFVSGEPAQGTDPPEPVQPEPGGAPIAETLTDAEPETPEAPRPIQAPGRSEITVPPKRQPRAIHTTIIRAARRHRDAVRDADAEGPAAMRRRGIALAIVLAMAAAAAGGWALAGTGGKHRARSNAAASAAIDRRLTTIVQALGATRTRELTKLQNARSSRAQQAGDATALQSAYDSAARQLLPLGGESLTARSLGATLTGTAIAYGRLAAAARAGDSAAYQSAANQVTADERQVKAEVGKL